MLARLGRGRARRASKRCSPPEGLHVLEAKDLPALLRRRFEENNGTVGTVFYVKYSNDVSLSDGHNLLRIAKCTDNVQLPDGTVVQTASRSTIFAEMIRSMERDGPLATVRVALGGRRSSSCSRPRPCAGLRGLASLSSASSGWSAAQRGGR